MKLSPKKFYNSIYTLIGDKTPINADCGKLCQKACCAVTDEITGMYLFPKEEALYTPVPEWGEIYDTDFEYAHGKYADLFTCDGHCERDKRPLACRIFPLVPYIKDGELKIIIDPRGKGICPLASVMKKDELSAEFVKRVEKAMKMCMAVKETREFITALSKELNETL